MVMIAEFYDYVIGGDPDRDTVDLAVLETGTGRVGAQLADAADGLAISGCSPGRVKTRQGGGSGRWKEPVASPLAWSCSSSPPVSRSSRLGRSSVPVAPRTIGSMPSAPAAKRWHATSKAHPALVACGRRCGWFSPAGKEFWSAAPRPSTN
jgi:hypothetical protein